jgi:acetyltransferase-like isoleucine patch superfamily enzyme
MIVKDKLIFRLYDLFDLVFLQLLRKTVLAFRGSKICFSTRIPKLTINWPHQLTIGSNCTLEDNLIFKYDSVWAKGPNIVIRDNVFIGNNTEFNISKKITIGDESLIASNCRFIDHDHGFIDLSTPIRLQESTESSIVIEGNVWIGTNCTILKGVSIGKGAIIGAGSVLNRNVPKNEVWAGIPAKFIKKR